MMRLTRQEVIDNHSRLEVRNELYRRYGYDAGKDLRFVLAASRPLPGRILEIGTGQGRFLAALLEHAARTTTVDLDPAEQRLARLNLAWVRPRGQARFVVADAAHLPWRDGAFDCVVSVNALHHMIDIPGVLREIVRIVRPAGKIVLADFNARGFAILQRVHRLEGRDHERVKYRFADLVRRFAALGWNARLKYGNCITVLIARRTAARGRRRLQPEQTRNMSEENDPEQIRSRPRTERNNHENRNRLR
jgi:ubiquinone/menaquinone biosynthesis C-methylase UbiE